MHAVSMCWGAGRRGFEILSAGFLQLRRHAQLFCRVRCDNGRSVCACQVSNPTRMSMMQVLFDTWRAHGSTRTEPSTLAPLSQADGPPWSSRWLLGRNFHGHRDSRSWRTLAAGRWQSAAVGAAVATPKVAAATRSAFLSRALDLLCGARTRAGLHRAITQQRHTRAWRSWSMCMRRYAVHNDRAADFWCAVDHLKDGPWRPTTQKG